MASGITRDRLRDGDRRRGNAAAAYADVGGGRPHGAADRRAAAGKDQRRSRRTAGRRAGCPARRGADPGQRRGGDQRGGDRRGPRRGCDRGRPQRGIAASFHRAVRRARAHRVRQRGDDRGAVPARGSRHRHGDVARRPGAEAHHQGDGESDEARLGHRRCLDRPGRRRGDLAADQPFGADLLSWTA